MLSADLRNLVQRLDHELQLVNEGGRITVRFVRVLRENLAAACEQAEQLEAQMAPGSPAAMNVTPLGRKAVR